VDQYLAWRVVDRREARRAMRAVRREHRHAYLMDYVQHLVLNALGAGITAVAVGAVVALVFLFAGHPAEGAAVFGSVATLASVFVTGRMIHRKR
jgi:hypothetical protein